MLQIKCVKNKMYVYLIYVYASACPEVQYVIPDEHADMMNCDEQVVIYC
jgi:hypothetical protein